MIRQRTSRAIFTLDLHKGRRGNLDKRLSLATSNILTASNPALVALLTETVAGTPLDICIANNCVSKKRLWWCVVQSF